jgi:hypothetical protein
MTDGYAPRLRHGLRESLFPERANVIIDGLTGATISRKAFTSAIVEQLTVDCRKIRAFKRLQK